MLAEGKTVEGFDDFPADLKERLQKRAEEYRTLGPWKDRPSTGKGAGKGGRGNGGGRSGRGGRGNSAAPPVGQAALLTLLASLATGKGLSVPMGARAALPRVAATVSKYGNDAAQRVIVDTGNLTGYHIFNDRSFFSSFDATAIAPGVASATNDVSQPEGVGDCDVIVLDEHGNPIVRAILSGCTYIPGFGVNLISVARARSNGAIVNLNDHHITLNGGATFDFDDDFTFRIVPTPNGAYPAVVSRGKHGPTHISANKLSPNQQLEMDLWSARLNGATAETLRHLDSIADGTPAILRRATIHNSLSESRILADGRRMPAPELPQRIDCSPGQRTAIDWWDAPCTGILGSNGLFAPVDISSGHFYVYPRPSKADSPHVIDTYLREAARDGVKISTGNVVISDNERIFTGRPFEQAVIDSGAVHEYSAEYEPWGNGAAEHVNAVLPAMMRAAHIQGGAPDEFWEFSAVDCARLLCRILQRNGMSLREAWCGKRGSLKRRKVLFCRVIARKPISWREGKLDDRAIECVNCGEARNKQGWYCWSREHGIVTSTNCVFYETEFPFKSGTTFVHHPHHHGHSSGLRVLTGLSPGGGGGGRGGDAGDGHGNDGPDAGEGHGNDGSTDDGDDSDSSDDDASAPADGANDDVSPDTPARPRATAAPGADAYADLGSPTPSISTSVTDGASTPGDAGAPPLGGLPSQRTRAAIDLTERRISSFIDPNLAAHTQVDDVSDRSTPYGPDGTTSKYGIGTRPNMEASAKYGLAPPTGTVTPQSPTNGPASLHLADPLAASVLMRDTPAYSIGTDATSLVMSDRRRAHLAKILRDSCVAVYNHVLHATRVDLDCVAPEGRRTNGKLPGGIAASIASATSPKRTISRKIIGAPNKTPNLANINPNSYVPLPKERLSDLDEAIQAIWAPADEKEINGILEWAKVIKVKDLPEGTKIIGSTTQRKFKRDGTAKTRVCVHAHTSTAPTYQASHTKSVRHSAHSHRTPIWGCPPVPFWISLIWSCPSVPF